MTFQEATDVMGGEFDKFAGEVGSSGKIAKPGNLEITKNNVDDANECVVEVKEFVIDVRDALGVFKEIEAKARTTESVLNSLEKIAKLASKVPPVANVAKKLEDVFDLLGDAAGDVKKTAGRIADRVEPIREVMKDLRDALKKVEDKLDKVSDRLDEVLDGALAIQLGLATIEDFDADIAEAIEECLDKAVAPANSYLVTINGYYVDVREQIDPIKDLLDPKLGNLGSIDVAVKMSGSLDKIVDLLDVVKKPLNKLDDVITPRIEDVLDAADRIYDAVAAPVINPILKATGIEGVIEDVEKKLKSFLPDADDLTGIDDFLSDFESLVPGIDFDPDVNVLETGFAQDFGFTGMLAAFDLDAPDTGVAGLPFGVPQANGGGYDATPDIPVDSVQFTEPVAEGGLGFATLNEIAESLTGISLADLIDKSDFWQAAGDAALDLTGNNPSGSNNGAGGVLIGSSQDDTLERTRDGNVDILVGGDGDDTFAWGELIGPQAGIRDIFIGGAGNDIMDARGPVAVVYRGLISDYYFEKLGNNKIIVEHLNPDGGVDEGTDVVQFASSGDGDKTRLVFDGYEVGAQTFFDGLKNITGNFPETGDDVTIRNFVFGNDSRNIILTGQLDDLLVGRGGSDVLDAGNGNDYLDGGRDADVLYGGAGKDIVDLRSHGKRAEIFLGDSINESNGGTSTELAITGVETIIGTAEVNSTGKGDILFGDPGKPVVLQGRDDPDLLRSSGGTGTTLFGGRDDDTLILDSGSDTAYGNSGKDLFMVALDADRANNSTTYGTGNSILGGSGDDTLSYSYLENSGSDARFFDDNPESFGTGYLDLSSTMAGGSVSVDTSQSAVTRSFGGVDVVDTYNNIETLVGTASRDVFWLNGPDGSLVEVNGGGFSDIFIGAPSAEFEGGTDLTSVGPLLHGGNNNDRFYLRALYDIDGGDGDLDVLDLSAAGFSSATGEATSERLQWYLDFNDFAVFDRTEDDGGTNPQPQLLDVFGDPDDTTGALSFYEKIVENSDYPSTPSITGSVTVDNVEHIIGGGLNDILLVRGEVRVVEGGDGNDVLAHQYNSTDFRDLVGGTLLGQDGDDVLIAGARKQDSLFGGEGNDRLDFTAGGSREAGEEEFGAGGVGADSFFLQGDPITIYGGDVDPNGNLIEDQLDITDADGNILKTISYIDTISFSGGRFEPLRFGSESVTIDLNDSSQNGGAATDHHYFGIENVVGSNVADTIYGDEGDNVIVSSSRGIVVDDGDHLYGRGGNDVIVSQDGNTGNRLFEYRDSETVTGPRNYIYGGGGADVIYASLREGSFTWKRTDQRDRDAKDRTVLDIINGGANGSESEFGLPGDLLSFDLERPDGFGETEIVSAVDGELFLSLRNNEASLRRVTEQGESRERDYRITLIEHVRGISFGSNELEGDDFGNVLIGGDVRDLLKGREGNDILDGGLDNDILNGNSGDDTLLGSQGDDILIGAEFNSTADADFDVADFSANTLGIVVQSDDAGTISRNWFGTSTSYDYQSTVLSEWIGDTGQSTAYLDNIDRIIGGLGDDTFFAGSGTDDFDAGAGNDRLDFGASTIGVDINLANPNSNGAPVTASVTGGFGAARYLDFENVYGTDFQDTLTGNVQDNVLSARQGDDTLYGRGGSDMLLGGQDNDVLYGGGEDDTLRGGPGADVLYGGDGQDTLDYSIGGAVQIDLAANTASGNQAAGDMFFDMENVLGSNEADILFGDDLGNVLDGNSGNDTLDGGGGDDLLLLGAFATATVDGGAGSDTLQITSDAGVEIDLRISAMQNIDRDGGTRHLGMMDVENLTTGAGNDRLDGDNDDNVIIAGAGDDNVKSQGGADLIYLGDGDDDSYGGSGEDTVFGGTGDDKVRGAGGADILYGGGGNDTIRGGTGDDTLFGGDGNDVLRADEGGATLTGGAGGDSFVVNLAQAGLTVISDFEVATRNTNDTDTENDVVDALVLDVGSLSDLEFYNQNDATDIPDSILDTSVADSLGDRFVLIRDTDVANEGLLVIQDRQAADFGATDRTDTGAGSAQAPTTTGATIDVSDSQETLEIDLGAYTSDPDGVDDPANLLYQIVIGSAAPPASDVPQESNAQPAEAASALTLLLDLDFLAELANAAIALVENAQIEGSILSIDINDILSFLPDGFAQSFALNFVATDFFGLDSNVSTISLNVAGQNDLPVFTSADGFVLQENGVALVGNVAALDADYGETPTYAVTGGADAAHFEIDESTGALRFVERPDFEAPGDANGDNAYEVEVTATSESDAVVEQISVLVVDDPAELINGTNAGDLLFGSRTDNVIKGSLGSDFIAGGDGNDTISGGEGDDYLLGQRGDDVLNGNAGNDFIAGGNGADTMQGGKDDDNILGQGDDDLLHGNAGADSLRGGDGSDLAYGGSGSDRLFGGANADSLFGGSEDDFVQGGSGHDSLFGGAGNDTLYGGAGQDFLDGGRGNDLLNGGDRTDVFVFTQGSDNDEIRGFGDDQDTLELSAALVGGLTDIQQILDTFALELGGGVNFDFQNGTDFLRITGITAAQLTDDILVV